MKNILHTAREWLTRSVRRAKGLKLDSKLFVQSLAAILAVLLVVIVIVLSTPSPEWVYPLLGLSQKSDALRFLGFGIGGTLLALGAVISYRRAKALEDTARAQVRANENSEQGLRQERMKNAIEHLANSSASVRLGGAYELFHLAKDTRDLDQTEDLSQTALDILCAHIRQTTRETEYRAEYESVPSEEIESLLSLLFVERHEIFKDRNINLKGAFLQGANLADARLQKATLMGAELRGVFFPGAHLRGADLTYTDLRGAVFFATHLPGADFWGARLHCASFLSAHLPGASFLSAHLPGANLREAHLQGANFWGTHLPGANLRGAHLQGANFLGAHLPGANLRGAYLQGANFRGAHLQGVGDDSKVPYVQDVGRKDKTAYLQRVIFEGRIRYKIGKESDLSHTIFSGGLTQEKVDSIVESMLDGEQKKRLRELLIPHVGKPPSSELPKDSGAITGSYIKEEAEEWIAEYNEAMSDQKDPTS